MPSVNVDAFSWMSVPTVTMSSNTTQIWTSWTNQHSTTGASIIWHEWNTNTVTSCYTQPYTLYQSTYQSTTPLTPSQIEALTLQRGVRMRLENERQEERLRAEVKANRLLELVLSDEQRAELKTHRRFHVRGSRGRRYCIRANSQVGNVIWVDDAGKELGRFCAHPTGYLPDADAWLAQALALETDEDAFLAVANLHGGARPPAALLGPHSDDLVEEMAPNGGLDRPGLVAAA